MVSSVAIQSLFSHSASASTQLCNNHGEFAERIRSNLGLAQQSSLDSHPNSNHNDDNNATSGRPILFGDTIGAPQWLTNEIINGTISGPKSIDSVGYQHAISDRAEDLRSLLLSAVKTESEDENADATETTPIAPPTNQMSDDGGNDLMMSKGGDGSSGSKGGHTLRRSSRKPRRVRHYSEDLEAQLSDIQRRMRLKQKSMSSGASQLSRISGKRRRASVSEASEGEGAVGAGHESSAKRVCQRETRVTVNLEPLELGAKFKAEVEALNREEKVVVSSYTCTCTCMQS